jgi:hypothetical protein
VENGSDDGTLQEFIQAVLRRARSGKCTISDGSADVMHVIKGLVRDDRSETVVWMQFMLACWAHEDA